MFAFQDELNYLLGLCKLNFGTSFTALRIGIGSCVFNVFMYMLSFIFLLLLSKKKYGKSYLFKLSFGIRQNRNDSPAPEHSN